jgi:hypothetical protein
VECVHVDVDVDCGVCEKGCKKPNQILEIL